MELAQALAKALDFERRVRDHYANCARMTEDPRGRRVFAHLAREEQGHVEHLEALQEEWLSTGALTPRALPAGIVPGPGASLPDLDFLREALELESRTRGFYQKLVTGLDARHQPHFKAFLDQEEAHLAFVQAEIDALAGKGPVLDYQDGE